MRSTFAAVVLVVLLAALAFIPLLGACPLFDWDEINFAECAREMVVTGDYSHVQLNYRPFWEKPPFFIWLQALSMKIFGVNEFAARFPNGLCSAVTLACLVYLGSRIHSLKMGLIWALLYASALLPHLYFRSGLIDPWFNLFIFLSSWQCIKILNDPQSREAAWRALLAGVFLGVAVLTKGPAALIIMALGLFVYAVWSRSRPVLLSRPMLIFALTAMVVSLSWFAVEYARGNGAIIQEFIDYQVRLFRTGDAGHDGPFIYHFVVLLLGCFPASMIFILYYLRWRTLTPFQKLTRRVMLSLFWTVLLLFSIVETKIVHYSSFCYFPLTFVGALNVAQGVRITYNKWARISYWTVTAVIALAVLAISLFPFIKEPLLKSGLIADKFASMNLMANVSWSGFEWLLALLFLAASYAVYRAFIKDNLRLLVTGLLLQLFFVWMAITVIVPRVELYTQHAAIAFYQACAQHDCDIETHGFKSYAYIFYSQRQPSDFSDPVKKKYISDMLDQLEREGFSRSSGFGLAHLHWLEHGPITRPAYLVIKTPHERELMNLEHTTKLYDLNGFSFFVRLPDK